MCILNLKFLSFKSFWNYTNIITFSHLFKQKHDHNHDHNHNNNHNHNRRFNISQLMRI